MTLDIADIRSEGNVRVETGDVSTLAASIDRNGLLQPVVVAIDDKGDQGEGRYVLIAGHRRLAAVTSLHWETIDAVVNDTVQDAADMTAAQWAENMERKDLTDYEQMQVAWDLKLEGLKQDEVSKALGLTVKQVSMYQKIAKNLLADEDLDPARATQLTAGALFDIAEQGDAHPSDIIRLVIDEERSVWSAINMVGVEREAVEFYETLEPKLLEWKDQGIETVSEIKHTWWRVNGDAKDYENEVIRVPLADHITLDCHVISITDGGGMRAPSATHWCKRPKSHYKKDADVAPPDAAAKRKASEARSIEAKENRAAKQLRRDLAHAWKPKRTDIRMMAMTAFVKDSWREDQVRLACQLEDLSKERVKGADYGWYGKRIEQWFTDKKMSDEAIEAYKAKIILGYRYVEKQWPTQEVTDGIESKS